MHTWSREFGTLNGRPPNREEVLYVFLKLSIFDKSRAEEFQTYAEEKPYTIEEIEAGRMGSLLPELPALPEWDYLVFIREVNGYILRSLLGLAIIGPLLGWLIYQLVINIFQMFSRPS